MFPTRFRIVPVTLAGVWLLGGCAVADVQPRQPTTQSEPLRAIRPQEPKKPATLAEIVTFSMQDDQVIGRVRWKPTECPAYLSLLDIPGETQVIAPEPSVFAPDGMSIVTIRQDGKEKDTLIVSLTEAGPRIVHSHRSGNRGERSDSLQLLFDKNEFTLSRSSFAPGQPLHSGRLTEPSWPEFLDKHPDDVDKDVRPLLETLHFQSLLGPTDLWAYQVFADRLKPTPDTDALVKQLVQQLSDASPEKRDAACDSLKKLGYAALARVDRKQLTPKQAEFLAAIAQGGFLDDQQVKAYQTDKTFLLDCLRSRDQAVRAAAAAQLQAVLGRPIDFDPAAPASDRGEQIHKLRQQLVPTTQKSGVGTTD